MVRKDQAYVIEITDGNEMVTASRLAGDELLFIADLRIEDLEKRKEFQLLQDQEREMDPGAGRVAHEVVPKV